MVYRFSFLKILLLFIFHFMLIFFIKRGNDSAGVSEVERVAAALFSRGQFEGEYIAVRIGRNQHCQPQLCACT